MSRKADHQPVDVNIKNAVERVYSLLKYEIRKSRITFRNEVPADLNFPFDVHDLQQLLLNLFINAIHAMEPEGVLTARASLAGRDRPRPLVDL
jgi:signal transduction histidine kinase